MTNEPTPVSDEERLERYWSQQMLIDKYHRECEAQKRRIRAQSGSLRRQDKLIKRLQLTIERLIGGGSGD